MTRDGVNINNRPLFERYFDISEIIQQLQLPNELERVCGFYDGIEDAKPYIDIVKILNLILKFDLDSKRKSIDKALSDIENDCIPENITEEEYQKLKEANAGMEYNNRKLAASCVCYRFLKEETSKVLNLDQIAIAIMMCTIVEADDPFDDVVKNSLSYLEKKQGNSNNTEVKFKKILHNNENAIRNVLSSCGNSYNKVIFLISLVLCAMVDYDEELNAHTITGALPLAHVPDIEAISAERSEIILPFDSTNYKKGGELSPVKFENDSQEIRKYSIADKEKIYDVVFLKPQETVFAMKCRNGYVYFLRNMFGQGAERDLCIISGKTITVNNCPVELNEFPVSSVMLNSYGLLYNNSDGELKQVALTKASIEPFKENQKKIVSMDFIDNIYCFLCADGTTQSNYESLRKTEILRILPGTGNWAFIHDDFSASFMNDEDKDGKGSRIKDNRFRCMAVISFLDSMTWLGIDINGKLQSNASIPDKISGIPEVPVYVKANGFQFHISYADGSWAEYPVPL